MKSILIKGSTLLTLFLLTFTAWAQDEKKLDVDIDVNKGDSNWYQQPWVWVIGAAVFILLLAAILKGGNRKEA